MIEKLSKAMETDIILAAKQLIEEGKEPTVALVKARLSRPLTMPIIIMVLQKISGFSLEELTKLLPADVVADQEALEQKADNEIILQAEIVKLSNKLDEMQKQLTALTKEFKAHTQESGIK